jgi:hypothetical protein
LFCFCSGNSHRCANNTHVWRSVCNSYRPD